MGQAIRSFTLDHEVSRRIDQACPRGERSRLVNRLLKQALTSEEKAALMMIFSVSHVVVTFAFFLGLGLL